MANNDEDIVFDVKLENAKSLSELKKLWKEQQAELEKTQKGTKAYEEALRRLGAIKDEIGDLKDVINALNPEGKIDAVINVAGKLASGFQAAAGAAALFGVESEALEKTLLKVQAATAFAEGIRGIVGMKDAFAVLGQVIKANPIWTLVSVLSAVAASVIYLTRETENLEEEIKKENAVINENIKILERQIEILEAMGNKDADIIKLKREKVALQIQEIENSLKIQKENLKEAEQLSFLEELMYSTGIASRSVLEDRAKRVSEVNDKIKKSESEIADLKNHLAAEEIKTNNKLAEEARKRAEEEEKLRQERIKRFQDFLSENLKAQQDYDAFIADEKRRQHEQELKDFEDQLKAQKDIEDKIRKEEDDEQKARIKEDLENFKKSEADKTKAKDDEEARRRLMVDLTFSAAKTLSDAYFQDQLNLVKGNAKKELEVRKKQFEADKAFSIARAVIDGVRSVQAALTIAPPAGYILAALSGALAAANIVKIATTKFDGGPAAADTSAVSNASPNIQTQAPVIQPTTRLDEQGRNLSQPQVVKAVVVETEMTGSQNRVKRLGQQATFP